MLVKINSIHVVKFDKFNFQVQFLLWKFSIFIMLNAEKSFEIIVEGPEARPAITAVYKTTVNSWDDRNTKAQIVLTSTIP